jgi:putative DNA primase/helicase
MDIDDLTRAAQEAFDPGPEIDAAIASHDLAMCYRLAPQVARLEFIEQLAIKTRVRSAFPQDFGSRDWDRLIKEAAEPVRAPAAASPSPEPDAPDLLRYMLNDAGNAERIIALHGTGLRYCHALHRWLVWDGRRWAADEAGRAEKLAKETALAYLAQALDKDLDVHVKFAKQSLDHRRVTSALASAECELPITPAEMDTQPDVLNCLNGMVDLRPGGALLPHDPTCLITKLCQHNYNPAATCPRFMDFLHRIMGAGDAEVPERTTHLVGYLQRAFGYSLTGWTSEKSVFILHGGGNNGKTTLLSTVSKIIEEYAVVLQVDSLMVKQESNNSQADLADLRGARFVMTSETEEGQRLNEGKLKRITQGMGRIKAVRKYENPITFYESHKLWVDANHRPDVRGVDAAIWNRLHLIPFDVTITPEEIDRELPAKLAAEAEGILAWMVAGAMRWYAEGLGRPPEVSAAGEEWRAASNQVGRFVDECCIRLLTAEAKARNLYGAYRKWAEEAGEKTESETKFSARMAALGFSRNRRGDGMMYAGIGFRDTSWG